MNEPVLPLRDIVVFPQMIVPLFVGRNKSVKALEIAMSDNKDIVLVTQKVAKVEDPKPKDLYSIGTICKILQLLKLPDGTLKVLVEGKKRVKINFLLEAKDFFIRNNIKIQTYLIKNCDHHIPIEASSIALNYLLKKIK